MIRRECLVWLQFFDRINRGKGLARAWDGTDPRRCCGGVKTIDEIVRPNNGRGVDDDRRLCSPNAYFHATDSATDWQAQKYTFGQHSPGKNAFAPLAQLAEQLTLSQRVAGSIPARCILRIASVSEMTV